MGKDNTTIRRELKDIQTQIAGLEKNLKEKPDYGLGKGNAAFTRRQSDRALLQRLKKRAESLKQALARLEEGSYGRCTRCGKPIHPDRLAVLPDCEICIECAQKLDKAYEHQE